MASRLLVGAPVHVWLKALGLAPAAKHRGTRMRLHPMRFLPFFLLGAACSSEPPSPSARLGQTQGAIINGVLDTSHPAVVALFLGSSDSFEGSCSGTIVRTEAERRIGWVATAAHCVGSGVSLVVQTEDYASADAI